MKKSRIIEIFNFLSAIKINKVDSKDVRSAIISNHLMLYKIVQHHDDDVKELSKKLFEGKENDIEKLNELREKFKSEKDNIVKAGIIQTISSDYSEILALEKEYTEALITKLNEDVEITLKKVDKDIFVDACVAANVDITPIILIQLEDILD